MYYTYVLRSLSRCEFYVGFTTSLKVRVKQHFAGQVQSTKKKRPLRLLYYEVCWNKEDALRREKYLKTTFGKAYLNKRLRRYFECAI